MHHLDQRAIRTIARELLRLLPMTERNEDAARKAFTTARKLVEEQVGAKQSDHDHEEMLRKFRTPA